MSRKWSKATATHRKMSRPDLPYRKAEAVRIISGLPYADSGTTRSHVDLALEASPYLAPSTDELIHQLDPSTDQWGAEKLLKLGGTIEIYHRGSKYYIPVEVYVPLRYPITAPIGYVRPTTKMQVTPGHRFVDTDCNIKIPYLQTWQPGSNLKDCIKSMQSCFSQQSPVQARAAPMPQPSFGSGAGYGSSGPSQPSTVASHSTGTAAGGAASGVAAIRQNANTALRNAFTRVARRLIAEITSMQKVQDDLKAREQRRVRDMQELEGRMRAVESRNYQMQVDAVRLETAMEAYAARAAALPAKELDVDADLVAGSPLQAYLLRLHSHVEGTEDVLEALRQALEQGSISAPEYAFEARRRAKKQFEAKVLVGRISKAMGAARGRGGGRGAGASGAGWASPAAGGAGPSAATGSGSRTGGGSGSGTGSGAGAGVGPATRQGPPGYSSGGQTGRAPPGYSSGGQSGGGPPGYNSGATHGFGTGGAGVVGASAGPGQWGSPGAWRGQPSAGQGPPVYGGGGRAGGPPGYSSGGQTGTGPPGYGSSVYGGGAGGAPPYGAPTASGAGTYGAYPSLGGGR